jgi:protein-S-isoprenylcysteine O-methyltransferase Ste14
MLQAGFLLFVFGALAADSNFLIASIGVIAGGIMMLIASRKEENDL